MNNQIINEEDLRLPGFLLSSLPKSGTHLLKQILLGIPNVFHKPGNIIYEGLPKDHETHKNQLIALEENEFLIGHIYHSEIWEKLLCDLNIKHIFIIRDPRDVIVSLSYFISDHLPNHQLYELFQTMTKKEQYLTLINGIYNEQIQYGNIVEWYALFSGWLNDSQTLSVKYEDLMISDNSRRHTIQKIANYLCTGLKPSFPFSSIVQRMEKNIQPDQSPTFRKGKIRGWESEFDDEVKKAFNNIASDLLINLGYEKNKD